MKKLSFIIFILALGIGFAEKIQPIRVGGCMQIPGDKGQTLPLLHTDVKGLINGIIGHTTVKQTFRNDTSNTLELTYVFPMPHRAAIGQYQFTIGKRIITGVIKTRENARELYNQARESRQNCRLARATTAKCFCSEFNQYSCWRKNHCGDFL